MLRNDTNMEEELFRKQSLDKIKNPEELNDYLKVTKPGVWILLVSLILLLAGALVWSIFGSIDVTIETDVCIKNNEIKCYIADEDCSYVTEGMVVKYADTEAAIKGIESDGKGGYWCYLKPKKDMENGYYDGEICVENVQPISLLLN